MTKAEYLLVLAVLLVLAAGAARLAGLRVEEEAREAIAALTGGPAEVRALPPQVRTPDLARDEAPTRRAPAPANGSFELLALMLVAAQPGPEVDAVLREVAANPIEPPSRLFEKLLALPGARSGLDRPGRAQPLLLPAAPPDIGPEQRREIDAARARVGVEWDLLAGSVVDELGYRVEHGHLRHPSPEHARAYRDAMRGVRPGSPAERQLRFLDDLARRTLDDLNTSPTPGKIFGEAAAVRVPTERYRDAYLAYVGMVGALRAGGEFRIVAPGRPVGIRYPDGSAAHPIWEGRSLAGITLVSPSGELTVLRAFRDGWRTGPSLEETPVRVAGTFSVTPDGRIVREVRPPGDSTARPTLRETRLVDGRRIVEETATGTVRVFDARGKLVAIGASGDPGRWTELRYENDVLVEVTMPPPRPGEAPTVWRKNAQGEWTDGRSPPRATLEVAGTKLVGISPAVEVTENVRKIFRYKRGDTLDLGIYIETRDGWSESFDPTDVALVRRLRELARERRLPANDLQPDTRRPVDDQTGERPWLVEDNWFVRELRAAGLASRGTVVTLSSSSPRQWDRRGGAGRLVSPSFVFTTVKQVRVQILTEQDLVTGRVTTVRLPVDELAWFRERHDRLRDAGAIPPELTLVQFVVSYRQLKLQYYRGLEEMIDTMLRHLLGDDEMARRGFGRRGQQPIPGLLRQGRIVDPMFFSSNTAADYRRTVEGRAVLLVENLLAHRREVRRRLALAEDGRWRALAEDEAREPPDNRLDLQSLLGLLENFERGLPTEEGALRFLGAMKHGVRSAAHKIMDGIVENPLLVAGLIALGIINPALGLGVGTALLLGNVIGGGIDGLDLVLRGIAEGNDELYYRGVSKLTGAGVELGVGALLTALAARSVRGPAAQPPGDGRALIIHKLTNGDAALARQLRRNPSHRDVETVVRAWERAADILSRGGRQPLPPPFRTAYENALTAYRDLCMVEGWVPVVTRGATGAGAARPPYSFDASSRAAAAPRGTAGVYGAADDGRPTPTYPRLYEPTADEARALARFREDLVRIAAGAERSPIEVVAELRRVGWIDPGSGPAVVGRVRVAWGDPLLVGESRLASLSTLVDAELAANPGMTRAMAIERVANAYVREVTGHAAINRFNYDPATGLVSVPERWVVYGPRGERALNLANPIEAELAHALARLQLEEVGHGAGFAVRRGHYTPLFQDRMREFEAWFARPGMRERIGREYPGVDYDTLLRKLHEAETTEFLAGRAPHRPIDVARYPVRSVYLDFAVETALGEALAAELRALHARGAITTAALHRIHRLSAGARDPAARAALRRVLEPLIRRGGFDDASLDRAGLTLERRLRYDVRVRDPVTGLPHPQWPRNVEFGELVDAVVVDVGELVRTGRIRNLDELLVALGPRYRPIVTRMRPDDDWDLFGVLRRERYDWDLRTPIGPTSRYARWGEMFGRQGEHGRVVLRIDGEEIGATEWIYFQDGVKLMVHTPAPQVPKILRHCERLYQRALRQDLPFDETVRTVAELHYYLAHATPYLRGSAGISDMVTKIIFDRRGIHVGPWRENVAPDLDALVQPDVNVFVRQYSDFFVTPPRPTRP